MKTFVEKTTYHDYEQMGLYVGEDQPADETGPFVSGEELAYSVAAHAEAHGYAAASGGRYAAVCCTREQFEELTRPDMECGQCEVDDIDDRIFGWARG